MPAQTPGDAVEQVAGVMGSVLSPQKVRKTFACGQLLPTVVSSVSAGQTANAMHSQPLPTTRGEFELYFDI